jgi:hypothetical protein
MTYKKWFRKNEDKLIEDYEVYFNGLDKEIFVPLEFDDYCYDKWEDAQNSYCEREEQ